MSWKRGRILRLLSALLLLRTAYCFSVPPRPRVLPPHHEDRRSSVSTSTHAVTEDDQKQGAHGGWPKEEYSRRSGVAKAKRTSQRALKQQQQQQQQLLTLEEKGGGAADKIDPYAASAVLSRDGSYLIRYSRFDNLGAACALLVSGFFGSDTVWFAPLCMRELHRLRSNFPVPGKDCHQHRMFVAELPPSSTSGVSASDDLAHLDELVDESPSSPPPPAVSWPHPPLLASPQEQAAAAVAAIAARAAERRARDHAQGTQQQPFSKGVTASWAAAAAASLSSATNSPEEGEGEEEEQQRLKLETTTTTTTTTTTKTKTKTKRAPSKAEAEAEAAKDAARRLVGFVDLDARTPKLPASDDAPRPYLSDLAVCPAARRRGIARALLQRCEDVARLEWGFDRLYLKVERTNVPAMKLYLGRGYKVEKEYDDSNKVLMCKHFPAPRPSKGGAAATATVGPTTAATTSAAASSTTTMARGGGEGGSGAAGP